MTKERLKRKIIRAKNQIKELEDKQDNLSKHGYWSLGYLKGRLTVLEDWLDDLEDNKNENI
jgi:hypothetical protein